MTTQLQLLNPQLQSLPFPPPRVDMQTGQINLADWNDFLLRLAAVTGNSASFSSGTGVNEIPQNYSQFNAGSLPPMSGTATRVYDTGWTLFGLASLKITGSGTTYFGATTGSFPFALAPSQKWIISVYTKATQAQASVVLGITTAAGSYTVNLQTHAVAGDVLRVYGSLDLTADSSSAFNVYIQTSSGGTDAVWLDGFMLEPQSGTTGTPSPYSLNTPSTILNTNPPGGVVNNLPYANHGMAIQDVVSSGGGVNVNPVGGVSGNLPHSNQSTQTLQVISNVGGNGQLNVSPTGGVTNTLPYANHAPSVTTTIVNAPDGNGSYLGHGVVFQPHIHANQIGWGHFIGDTSGDYVGNIADTTAKRFLHGAMSTGVQGVISSGSQVNVNPSGGVTGNLPYANHDVSVRTTLASTAGGDGSYLNTGQVFNRHLNSATQSGLADDATYLRWKQTQQTAILTNPGANHIVDPTFTSIADFWGNVGSASAGVLNQGAVGVSVNVANTNYDGRGNKVKVPLQQNDILVLQLTSTQAATGTADTYISAEFHQSDGTLISYANQAIVPSTGTATSVTTAPANTAYAIIFINTFGGASGGNAALVTNPQARINHETVTDTSGKKAYADFTDNTANGHIGKHLGNVPDDSGSSRYAVAAVDPNKKALIDYSQPGHANANLQYFGGIQSGTCYDGQAITFNPVYSSIPLVIFPSGGMTYSSTVGSATSQSLVFTASSLTTSGFTASLKLVTGGTLTARSDSFTTVTSGSEYKATLTNAPAYNNQYTVNWTLNLGSSSSGTVYIQETNSSGTILFQKNYVTAQNGAKATSVTWSGATGTSVIDINLILDGGSSGTISASTVTFTSGTAPSTNSAVPSTAPIPWVAFPQT